MYVIAQSALDSLAYILQTNLPRRRRLKGPPRVAEKYLHEKSPFANMNPLAATSDSKDADSFICTLTGEVFPDRTNPKGGKITVNFMTTGFTSDAVTMPPFGEYVSLKENVLAENNKKKLVAPYLADDQDQDQDKQSLWEELRKNYDLVYERWPNRNYRVQQCEAFRDYVDPFLEEAGCDMKDVLRYLLATDSELEALKPAGLPEKEVKTWLNREMSQFEYANPKVKKDKQEKTEHYRPDDTRWRNVYKYLDHTTSDRLARAGLACAAFYKQCDFSLWLIAEKSDCLEQLIEITEDVADISNIISSEASFDYNSIACRVCHL